MGVRMDIREVYASKSPFYKLAKRGFDVVASCGALVVLSPLMLATAIAIVIDDGRPVIYAAPRAGKDGKPFSMYKFRSMKRGADAMRDVAAIPCDDGCDVPSKPLLHEQGPAFKVDNDPRVTRVGRFIRTYFIDELPQLVNVARGQMSLVGPRAIEQTREYTPYEAQRLVVQPGLTCYWQTSGNMRMPWEEWLELDLDYIEDMSVACDLRILARSVGVVVRGEGG